MKIFVKTLKGSQFDIQVNPHDSVADVKRTIETVQGSDVYPAAQQMLIYQGKVLKDGTTLIENNVAENSFVVIMLSKSKSSSGGGSTTSTAAAPKETETSAAPSLVPTPAVSQSPASTLAAPAPAPAPAAAVAPVPMAAAGPEADVYDSAASNLVAGSNLEGAVQQILDMGGGTWDRDTVIRALRAAYNNPERAVEYLYSGIPEQAEAPAVAPSPPIGEAATSPGQPSPAAAQPLPIASTGPNANPLDLFPQGLPDMGSNAAGAGNLDFLRNNQQFQSLRAMVQSNPQILQPMLQELGKQNPNLMRLIQGYSSNHQDRVSPWEIDHSGLPSSLSIQSSPRLKKPRTSLQATQTENPINARAGFLDFEESVRSSKVLQGQENVGLASVLNGYDTRNCSHNVEMPSIVNHKSEVMGKNNFTEFTRTKPFTTYTGFLESNRFPRVLQGQEICSLRSLTGKTDVELGASGNSETSCNLQNMYYRPAANFHPLASAGIRNMYTPYNDLYKAGPPGMLSYTNFPNEAVPHNPSSVHCRVTSNEEIKQNLSDKSRVVDIIPSCHNFDVNSSNEKDEGSVTNCKLFGFPLTGKTSTSTSQCACKRSCIKVHKQGNLVGRAIDLTKLHGYDDLLLELERLFSMESLLRDPVKGWRVLFTDDENDMMVVGDDPWNEFCRMVSKIHIHTQEEVQKMMIGMMSDDTQSCLEEAPIVMDASKSPSVGQAG